MVRRGSLFLLAWLLALGGCAHPVAPVVKPVEIDASEYGRVYRAAIDELHDEGFTLDREEYRFGLVTTRPLLSPTLLEPWKSINATSYQAMQATTTDQRRVVSVHIQPIFPGSATGSAATQPAATQPSVRQPASSFRLSVRVVIEQAELTDRRLSGSTSGPTIINTLSAEPGELRERGIPRRYWEAVGRDPFLEHRILAAVVRRSIESTEPPFPPPVPVPAAATQAAPESVSQPASGGPTESD